MSQRLLKITRFMNKKSTIKMLAVIFIIGIFFFHHTYAAEDGVLTETQAWLDKGLGFLSRIWIFLAIIAGKLMTNDAVYGVFLGLDKYLRDIRNVMKNFANFGLAALILYSIISYVIDKKGDDPKKIIVKALVAGVLIQMSRFMAGALMDLSSIATSAVAAFPANFIGDNSMITNVKSDIDAILAKPRYVATIEDGGVKRKEPLARTDGGQCGVGNIDGIDAIMPKYDSVSGPLIFIGMSFFKVQNYMNHGVLPDTISGGGQLLVNLALKFLILLAYAVCMIGLIIANLIRIQFLQLLIMISPLAVLIGVFGKKLEGKGMTKYFNIATFMDLVFKPLFFIGFIGLTLILVTSMQQIMGGDKGIKDMGGVAITVNTGASKIDMPGVADFQINGNVFGDIAGGSKTVFVDLMLIIITLLLLRQMLKISIEFGEGPVQDVMKKITPLVEDFVKTLPILPTPGGEKVGLSGFLHAGQKSTQKILKGFGMETTGKFAESEQEFQKQVYKKFLGVKPEWGITETDKLKKVIRNDGDFRGEYIKAGQDTSTGISLSNASQFERVEEWFNRNKTLNNGTEIFNRFGVRVEGGESFDAYFQRNKSRPEVLKSLHILLGGDPHVQNKRMPTTYEELKSNRYRYEPRLE